MENMQLEAQLQPVTRRADGSVTIKFISGRELTSAELAILDGMRGQDGWLLFSPNQISEDEIPEYDASMDDAKSPSERLRGVLYRLHIQNGGTNHDFIPYYRNAMERFIDNVKERLE